MELGDVSQGMIVYAKQKSAWERGKLGEYVVEAGPVEHRSAHVVKLRGDTGHVVGTRTVPVADLVSQEAAEAMPAHLLSDPARVALIKRRFEAAGLKPNSPKGYRVRMSGSNPLFTLSVEGAETLLRAITEPSPSRGDDSTLADALGLDS